MDFSRKRRLVTQAEYDLVFKKANKVNQKYLLALYRTNSVDFARVGIIVSKKTAKSSPTRNKIKRITRESFRAIQSQLKGIDIIVLARQNCGALSKTELREAINQLWDKLIACQKNG